MLLDVYVDRLRGELREAAAAGGEEMVAAASRLSSALDASVRLALLEALSDAAAEISAVLDGASVEVRLRGREPELVVDQAAPDPASGAPADDLPPPAPGDAVEDGDATARVTLRLPDGLKQRAEAAAAAARQSLNTWLVDAVRAAVDAPPTDRPRGRSRAGKQLSGWVR